MTGYINHLTNYWVRTKGIHSKDLGTNQKEAHPQIDDVILLIKFLEEFEQDFSAGNRISLHIIWQWCYTQRKPLTGKYFKILDKIGNRIVKARYHKAQAVKLQRQRIKALKNPAG